MSKSKLFIWIIILAIVVTVLLQNQSVFLEKQSIGINFYFVAYKTPDLPVAVYFLATLVIGLVVSYLFGLSEKWRSRKTVKGLTATLDSQRQELTSLKQELETLKNKPPEVPAQSFASDMNENRTGEAETDTGPEQENASDTQTGDSQTDTSEEDEKS